MILMGRDSDSMRDELVRRRPELSGVLHATGTLDADDLSLHLSACDVMLQPCQDGVTTRRGSVMASLSHGRPIVTTTGRLTESLWRESQAVLLVPDGDIRAIADKTQRVLRDHKERERLSNAARILYHEKFDIKHVVTALREAVA
jgi:glycosyltransferase involved in cell wall biosynthesis